MAPGLYDLDDGSVVAVGTVEHRDLEGGFWAVIGGTEAEGDAGKVVAVIANGDEFAQLFRDNAGLSFQVYGSEPATPRSGWPARRSPRSASCSRPTPGRRSSAGRRDRRPARRIRRSDFGGAPLAGGTTL